MGTVHTQQTAYATGTLNNIRSHLHSYILFSLATGQPYLSLSIPHLCDYLVFLSHSLSYGKIRNYISSPRTFFEMHHIHVDLFHDFYINLTLRGIKRLHGSSPSAKLPITPQLLVKLHSTINFALTLELVFGQLAHWHSSHSSENLLCFLAHPITLILLEISCARTSRYYLPLPWSLLTGRKLFSLVKELSPFLSLAYQAPSFVPSTPWKLIFIVFQCPSPIACRFLSTRLVLPFSRLHIPLLFRSFVINSHLLACHPIYILVIVFAMQELHLPFPSFTSRTYSATRGLEI